MWRSVLLFLVLGYSASAYVNIDGILNPAQEMRDAFRGVMDQTKEHMKNAKYFSIFQQALKVRTKQVDRQ